MALALERYDNDGTLFEVVASVSLNEHSRNYYQRKRRQHRDKCRNEMTDWSSDKVYEAIRTLKILNLPFGVSGHLLNH